MSFTEQQQKLIDRCKNAGFGWQKFALNVERQGFCTYKQEQTLIGMIQRIDTANTNFKSYGKNNINDCEIMSFGLHI